MTIENWLYSIPLKLRSLFKRKRVENELAEELRFHLEQRTEQNIASGMDPESARLEALRAMQGLEQSKEACRDTRGLNLIDNLARDLRYAIRMLRRSPGFTAVAVLSLALGIGANTAIFSLIDTLLLKPLPVPHADELRTLALKGNQPDRVLVAVTYPIFQALHKYNHVFSGLFAWSNYDFQMRSGPDMVHVAGTLASGEYFSTLGVKPLLGHTFTNSDDQSSGGPNGPVAVISYRFWSKHFHRSPHAIGSPLVLDRTRFTVIGIMPPDFFGAEVGVHPEIWVPLAIGGNLFDRVCMASRSCWFLIVMGRVHPGLSALSVNAGLQVLTPPVLHDALPTDWPPPLQKTFLERHIIANDGAHGYTWMRFLFTHPLTVLMTLVALVLLIACANLANLLLARASARNREIAVRLSLGAGRPRVIRQLLTESILLSLLGAAAGLAFAWWLTRILASFLISQPGPGPSFELDIAIDWRVALFTALVAGGSGLLFGLAPALRATHSGIASLLKESTHQLRRARRSVFARFLLPLQAALSVLLVAAAGLFGGSLFRLLHLDPGFHPQRVQLISLDTDKRPEKNAALAALYTRILERIQTLPGIQSASLLWLTPLSGGGWDQPVAIPGRSDLSEDQRDTYLNLIGPGFFETMQIPLLAGRAFNSADTAVSERVGIINQFAAERFFPHKNPIGEHLILDKTPIRIVGIAGNIKYLDLRDPDPPEMYFPYTQKSDGMPSLTFVVKTKPGARSLYRDLRTALHEIAPDVPIGTPKSLQQQLEDSIARERLMATLSLFFGALALLLTSVGLYGALAYDVTRRTGEIGIRMALGARMPDVMWLVVRESTFLVTGGIVIGVAAALALSKLVASLLYAIEPNDPRTLLGAVAALLAVAIAAASIPALRAARLDPTVSLRSE
ncbi:MAG TPA: ABC transporter permease [Bryobacteraceae bacterium]|jgi:predicted permease|nr:ABC transporter permease [Bryobacteraceae bacterium]